MTEEVTRGPEGTSHRSRRNKPAVTRETVKPQLSTDSVTERTTFQESTKSPTDQSTISQELTSQVTEEVTTGPEGTNHCFYKRNQLNLNLIHTATNEKTTFQESTERFN